MRVAEIWEILGGCEGKRQGHPGRAACIHGRQRFIGGGSGIFQGVSRVPLGPQGAQDLQRAMPCTSGCLQSGRGHAQNTRIQGQASMGLTNPKGRSQLVTEPSRAQSGWRIGQSAGTVQKHRLSEQDRQRPLVCVFMN